MDKILEPGKFYLHSNSNFTFVFRVISRSSKSSLYNVGFYSYVVERFESYNLEYDDYTHYCVWEDVNTVIIPLYEFCENYV